MKGILGVVGFSPCQTTCQQEVDRSRGQLGLRNPDSEVAPGGSGMRSTEYIPSHCAYCHRNTALYCHAIPESGRPFYADPLVWFC